MAEGEKIDTEGADAVRQAIESAEPVDPPAPSSDGDGNGSVPPDGGGGPPQGGDGGGPDIDWELVKQCAREPETDIGNGRRFLYANRRRVVHVQRIGFHVYDGTRWKEDIEGSMIRPLAHESAERIQLEAHFITPSDTEREALDAADRAERELGGLAGDLNEGQRKRKRELETIIRSADEIRKHLADQRARRRRYAKTSGNKGKLDGMLHEAAPYVSVTVGDMDAEPLAINCLNGTLRLHRDGEGRPWQPRIDEHDRQDLISKLVPVEYDPDAPAPAFETFLERVLPDEEIRHFVQRYLGYAFTALTSEQVFVFFWGQGRNGKSTLVDTVCRVFGDYATSVPFETLAGDDRRRGSEATPDLARLPGARLVRTAEPEQKMKFREAMVKSLTSGEPILVRRLHQDFVEVYPSFKLLVSGNHKPSIEGTDEGIWRRVLLVPWEVQIPKEEVDPHLPERLWAERSGILNWLIAGTLSYLERGLAPPGAVRAATDTYREESDPIGGFLRATCDITGNDTDWEAPGDLYAAYERYAKAEGLNPWQPTTFTRRLPDKAAAMGFRKAKSMGNTVYRGIRIKDQHRPAPGGEGGMA